jgi:hypothetical protein
MAQPIPSAVGGFDGLMNRMDFSIEDLQRHIDKIIRDCERWLPWLGPFARTVAEAIRALDEMTRKILSEIGKFFTQPGHPYALWVNGNRWVTEVGKKAGDRVGTMTGDYQQSDDKWKGPAADAFGKTLPPQKAALEKVQAMCNEIRDSLHNIALGIVGFWIGTALAVAKLVTELIPEGAATAVPPTAPAGIAAAVASVAGFLVLWGAIIAGFYEYLKNLFTEQSDLLAQLADNAAFPGPPVGAWPRSTTDNLADGSLSDGDTTDWQLRY